MVFTITEKKKQALLSILQSFFDGKLEEYRNSDDAGELEYHTGAFVNNIDKIEIADIRRSEGIWSVDLIFHMNRIYSYEDEDLIYDLSSGLTDYIGENDINVSQQEAEYGI
jgi:hypothetical protein